MKTSSEAFIYIIGLRFYFLPVFEGEADVVGSVDGAVVHQPMPALQRELGQLIRHGCKGFQEILYIPISFLAKDIIASNKLYIVLDANIYMFGVMISNVHMGHGCVLCAED